MKAFVYYERGRFAPYVAMSVDEVSRILDALPPLPLRQELQDARRNAIEKAEAFKGHEGACERALHQTMEDEGEPV